MPFSTLPPAHLKPPTGINPLVDYICSGPTCAIKVQIPDNIVPIRSVFYCDHCSAGYTWGQMPLPCAHVYFGVQLDANGDLETNYCRDCKVHLWTTTLFFGVNMGQMIGTTNVNIAPSSSVPGSATSTAAFMLPGLWGGLISPEKPKEEKVEEKSNVVLCISCQREMSKTLDAWYGEKDDPQGKKCEPCRRRK